MNQSPETPASSDATSTNLTNTDLTNTDLTNTDLTNPDLSNDASSAAAPQRSTAPPSFIKLAMRNMVRKGGTSLFHFGLTAIGLLGLLVGLAYLTR